MSARLVTVPGVEVPWQGVCVADGGAWGNEPEVGGGGGGG